ncbi:hypothetical protein WR25_11475 [Diploscapter pachys]|uniref:C2H2-type domain-containing protein n=1 Tax=Diploscapter pachys TaxID=2018661 RepID=A0A2A2J6J0_9BILA|nr:hypothetical protein WR25_11475 [Diploscapter pachys]
MKCPLCDFINESEDVLEIHLVEDHLDFLPWKCAECKTLRATKKLIDGHFMAVHGQANPEAIYVSNFAKEAELRRLLDQMKADAQKTPPSTSNVAVPNTLPAATTPAQVAIYPLVTSRPSEAPLSPVHIEDDELSSTKNSEVAGPSKKKFRKARTRSNYSELSDVEKMDISDESESEWSGNEDESDYACDKGRNNHSSDRIWECKKCKETAIQTEKHCKKHLYLDEKICCYKCSFPGCDFGHFFFLLVVEHSRREHDQPGKGIDQYPYIEDKSEQFREKLQAMMKECFSGQKPVKKTYEEQRKSKENERIDCLLCKGKFKYSPIYSNVVVAHFGIHMSQIHKLPRYVCNLCGHGTASDTSNSSHLMKEHNGQGSFSDTIEDWPIDKIRDVSQKSLGTPDAIFKILPSRWYKAYTNESTKNRKNVSNDKKSTRKLRSVRNTAAGPSTSRNPDDQQQSSQKTGMISDASFNENSPANLDESQGDAATLHKVDRAGKQKNSKKVPESVAKASNKKSIMKPSASRETAVKSHKSDKQQRSNKDQRSVGNDLNTFEMDSIPEPSAIQDDTLITCNSGNELSMQNSTQVVPSSQMTAIENSAATTSNKQGLDEQQISEKTSSHMNRILERNVIPESGAAKDEAANSGKRNKKMATSCYNQIETDSDSDFEYVIKQEVVDEEFDEIKQNKENGEVAGQTKNMQIDRDTGKGRGRKRVATEAD